MDVQGLRLRMILEMTFNHKEETWGRGIELCVFRNHQLQEYLFAIESSTQVFLWHCLLIKVIGHSKDQGLYIYLGR